MDTLPTFRRTIARAGLEDLVVAVVGRTTTVAAHWRTPLSLLFIDGGHGEQPRDDFESWAHWVMPGGLFAIHDVFPDPADGGRPPYEQIYLPALESGAFEEVEAVGSMRVLRRTAGEAGETRSAADGQSHSRAISSKCGASDVPRMMPDPGCCGRRSPPGRRQRGSPQPRCRSCARPASARRGLDLVPAAVDPAGPVLAVLTAQVLHVGEQPQRAAVVTQPSSAIASSQVSAPVTHGFVSTQRMPRSGTTKSSHRDSSSSNASRPRTAPPRTG